MRARGSITAYSKSGGQGRIFCHDTDPHSFAFTREDACDQLQARLDALQGDLVPGEPMPVSFDVVPILGSDCYKRSGPICPA